MLIWVLCQNPDGVTGYCDPIAVTNDEVVALEWKDRRTAEGAEAKIMSFHLNEVP